MAGTPAELLEAAQTWRASVGQGAPLAEDVEAVVRLELRDQHAAQEVLFHGRDALFRHWDALQAAIAAGGGAASGAPAASAAPSSSAAPLPTDDHGLVGVALGRLGALRTWLRERQAEDPGFNVADEVLAKVAQEDPADANLGKRLIPQLRRHRKEIAAVMVSATVTPEPARTEPAAPQTSADPMVPPQAAPAQAAPAHVAPLQTAPPQNRNQPSGAASPTGFAPIQWTESFSQRPSDLRETRHELLPDGGLHISWPEPTDDGMVRIFRVATSDGALQPVSPDTNPAAVTYDRHYSELRPLTAPTLTVRVWVNEGVDEASARAAQPRLYAEGGLVLPVRDCVIRAEGGIVVGRWSVSQEVERVLVERVPVELVAQYPHHTAAFAVDPELVTKGGFRDTREGAGGTFVYRVWVQAPLADKPSTHSPSVNQEIRLEAVLEPVRDLAIAERAEGRYDLFWTPPAAGRVEIYKTETPPVAGLDADVRTRRHIVESGLDESLILPELPLADGRVQMTDVAWPAEWSRIYFTPVTVVSEDRILVGETRSMARAGTIRDAAVVERVDKQFLTFAWPAGAAEVRIYRGPKGTQHLDPQTAEPIYSLNADKYQKHGGAHLEDPLPADGCSLQLVAVTFMGFEAKFSEPAFLEYPGLLQVRYGINPVATQASGFRRGGPEESTFRRVTVVANAAPVRLPMVVVFNATRLPLSPGDGQVIDQGDVTLAPGVPSEFGEGFDIAGRVGFVRLFAALPAVQSNRVAVLDPEFSQLRCSG